MNDCGRFHFVADMNADGAFTISDVWLWLERLYLLPSNGTVAFFQDDRPLASFFEITCATGQSWGGAIFSFFVWFIVFGIVAAMLEGR